MRVDKFKTFRKVMNFMVLKNALLGATFPMVRRYFWRRAAVTRPVSTVSWSSPITWSTSPGSRLMAKRGKGGMVRSMSTSGVMDRVTKKRGLERLAKDFSHWL